MNADYKTLVEEARALVEAERWTGEVGMAMMRVTALADAVDALQAENAQLRGDLHEWETVGAPAWVAAKDAQIAEVWAERDALQARLDESEAVIEKVREAAREDAATGELFYSTFHVDRALALVPSTVLAAHDREVAARAWDEGYGDDIDAHTPRTNPYQSGAEGKAAAGG